MSNDILGDVVAHDFDLLKVKDPNRDHFGILNVIIPQTVTDNANITITHLHLTLAHSKGQG